jgi:hypothetical protein
MKLSDLLEQVDVLVPNSLPNRMKIMFLNNIQRDIYREYPVPEATCVYTVTATSTLYELPDNCQEDAIRHVIVDGEEYTYQSDEGDGHGDFWTLVTGGLLVYPLPSEGTTITVIYRAHPKELTEADLDAIPGIPEDVHLLLVYAVAKFVAASLPEPDYNRVNFLDGQYLILFEKSKQLMLKPKQRRIKIVNQWE